MTNVAVSELSLLLERLKNDQEGDRSYLQELERSFNNKRRGMEEAMLARREKIVEIERAIQVLEAGQ